MLPARGAHAARALVVVSDRARSLEQHPSRRPRAAARVAAARARARARGGVGAARRGVSWLRVVVDEGRRAVISAAPAHQANGSRPPRGRAALGHVGHADTARARGGGAAPPAPAARSRSRRSATLKQLRSLLQFPREPPWTRCATTAARRRRSRARRRARVSGRSRRPLCAARGGARSARARARARLAGIVRRAMAPHLLLRRRVARAGARRRRVAHVGRRAAERTQHVRRLHPEVRERARRARARSALRLGPRESASVEIQRSTFPLVEILRTISARAPRRPSGEPRADGAAADARSASMADGWKVSAQRGETSSRRWTRYGTSCSAARARGLMTPTITRRLRDRDARLHRASRHACARGRGAACAELRLATRRPTHPASASRGGAARLGAAESACDVCAIRAVPRRRAVRPSACPGHRAVIGRPRVRRARVRRAALRRRRVLGEPTRTSTRCASRGAWIAGRAGSRVCARGRAREPVASCAAAATVRGAPRGSYGLRARERAGGWNAQRDRPRVDARPCISRTRGGSAGDDARVHHARRDGCSPLRAAVRR